MATQTINYDINVNAGGSVRTIQQMEQELNELNNEIKEVGVGSKAFETAATNIQKLEKELKKSQTAVEGFTLDKKLEVADGAIKIVAGSVAGLTGALGLLGIENENFDKLTAQATNAISFGVGIKDLSEGFGKLAKNINLSSIATKAAAIVQRVFNAILAANPIGLTILAITTLIGLVVALKDKFEAVNKVFEFFKGLVNSVAEVLGFAATEEEKAAARAKAASEQRIKDIDNELKVRKASGESTEALEREKYRRLVSLAEKGSQEQKDLLADQAAFEAGLLKKKQDDVDKADEVARQKREEARKKKKDEDDAAKAIADQKVIDDLKAIDDIKQEFLAMIEERDAETELAKAELEEERKLAELEKLGEDLDAIQAVRDYYAVVKDDAAKSDAQKIADIDKAAKDKALATKMAEIEGKKALEQEYIDIVGSFGNLLSQIAGESKELQIAGIVISQAANIAKIISNTSAANAVASILLSNPVTAAAGAAAITRNKISAAIGIASSVAAGAKAISAIKSAGSGGGGGGGSRVPNVPTGGAGEGSSAPSINQANVDLGVSPETQVGNNTVQAYVISGNITSAQEAESKLNSRRQISG